MQNDPESDDNTKHRFDFYKTVAHWLGVICLAMAIALAGEVWKELWDHIHPPAPNVIALYPDGRLQTAVVLDKPMLDGTALKQWAEQAVLATCNIDWVHWQAQLNAAADGLLPAAIENLAAEMKSKNIIKELQSDRLIEDCSLSAPSSIVKTGLINGSMYYQLRMPMLVRFRGESETRDRTLRETARVIVQQVDRSVKARGFGIAAIQAEPEKTPIDGSE